MTSAEVGACILCCRALKRSIWVSQVKTKAHSLAISQRLAHGFLGVYRHEPPIFVRNIANEKLIGEISGLKKNRDSHIDRCDFD